MLLHPICMASQHLRNPATAWLLSALCTLHCRVLQVAVPTSVGYGAALQGITPLLSSLVSSSPGVSVVNIDNGFGAAMVAARILKTAAKLRRVALAAQQR